MLETHGHDNEGKKKGAANGGILVREGTLFQCTCVSFISLLTSIYIYLLCLYIINYTRALVLFYNLSLFLDFRFINYNFSSNNSKSVTYDT